MPTDNWMSLIPLPLLFLLAGVMVAAAIKLGLVLGERAHERSGREESIGSTVGAALGLLAFMLGFTFSMAGTRFDQRKVLVTEEVSAIGTSYLRAGLLPGPYGPQMRELLREYVDGRVQVPEDRQARQAAIAAAEAIQRRMWTSVEAMHSLHAPSLPQSQFIESLNQAIDLHTKRVIVGTQFRIPGAIWFGLFVVTALAMTLVGYQCAQLRQRQLIVNSILAITFSAVITLIADLDRSTEGTVQLVNQPMLDLQRQLHEWPLEAASATAPAALPAPTSLP